LDDELHPPDSLQHAAAGADAGQRPGLLRVRSGAGVPGAERRRADRCRTAPPRLPPLPGPRPECDGGQGAGGFPGPPAGRRAGPPTGGTGTPAGRATGGGRYPAGGVDPGGPGPAEPGRVYYARMILFLGVADDEPRATAAAAADPAAFLRKVPDRPRLARPGL